MKLEYTFPNVPEFDKVSVMVENRGDKIHTDIIGRCSMWHRFIIKRYFAYHNKLGVIYRSDQGNSYSIYLPMFPSLAHNRMFEAFIASSVYKRPVPFALTIGVSADCQYHCMHCSAVGRPKDKPAMSTSEIKRVVDACLDLGVTNVTFTGGEPLLRDDLEDCIRSVPAEKAVCMVFTNGKLLTAERARSLKEAGAYGVHISLDSPDPATHDGLRGAGGAFQAVSDGVRNAREAGLLVGLSTYATRQSALNRSIQQMAGLAASWGVNELSVFDAIETGKFRGHGKDTLNRLSRMVLLMDNWLINRRYNNMPRMVTQTYTNSGLGFSRYIGCLAANLQVHVTAQGDLTPCDFTPLSVGNVQETSVKELWDRLVNHPAYANFSISCRMQNKAFRKKYIDTIPEDAELPYRLPV